MNISITDTLSLALSLIAILAVGSTHLRLNIWMFSVQTMLLSAVTVLCAMQRSEPQLYVVAGFLFALKAVGVPQFLQFIIKKVQVQRDGGTFIVTPVAMHMAIGFLIVSYLMALRLPSLPGHASGWPTATAAISLVCTGLIVMLTRRIALSQIVGFLVLENGIYLFGLTHTHSMPMLVEMGIMLDVLAGVMIAGLMAFRIKKNFEHIDITMLSDLKE